MHSYSLTIHFGCSPTGVIRCKNCLKKLYLENFTLKNVMDSNISHGFPCFLKVLGSGIFCNSAKKYLKGKLNFPGFCITSSVIEVSQLVFVCTKVTIRVTWVLSSYFFHDFGAEWARPKRSSSFLPYNKIATYQDTKNSRLFLNQQLNFLDLVCGNLKK